jgi:hypothetical protein
MSDRGFTHPNFGNQVDIEQQGRQVRLTFTAGTVAQAESLAEHLLAQLEGGALNLTLMGKPKSVIER